MKRRISRIIVDLIVFALGFLSLLAPFIFPQAREASTQNASFPLMVSLIIIGCLFIILFESQSSTRDNKFVPLLGVLISINAGLRFLENAFPGPAGFSPTFFLIILVGYFFGSRIGFLMGSMTMLVSGLLTGGVGPWLPGQMITAGWVGQSAGLLKPLMISLKWQNTKGELAILAAFGAVWGMLFGVIMNLWFWPFLGGGAGQTWLQSASLTENAQRYLTYYVATSLGWDITRAIGNVLVIITLTKPVMKILNRFKLRFSFKQFTEVDKP